MSDIGTLQYSSAIQDPLISYLSVNWQSVAIPSAGILFLGTGVYLETKRRKSAVIFNLLPSMAIWIFVGLSAFRFHKMDGESQGGVIITAVPLALYSIVMAESYLVVLRSSRRRRTQAVQ
jgi:predicted permease